MEDTTDQSRQENVELRDIADNEEDLWDEEEETSFIDDVREYRIDYGNDWLTTDSQETPKLDRLFGAETYRARNIGYFLSDVLLMENEVINPRFVKYLMKGVDIKVTKTLSPSGIITEYEASFYGEPYRTDEGVFIKPARKIKTTNGVIADPNELNQAVSDIRYHYDKFKELELRSKLKKAGIVGGIAIAVGALITGLSLGLKRKGSDFVRDSKQGSKIGPSGKMIPWTELQEATGKSLILIGDYIYVIIGGSLIYLYSTSSKRS